MVQSDKEKVQEQINASRQEVEESLSRHPVVSGSEWLERRRTLLDKEKAYVRQGDALAAEVRALPWVRITKPYTFTSMQGDLSLADLFGTHSQLFVKHFMMEPGQRWQCQGCSLLADHVNGLLPHFEHHDMAYVAVSRAPIEEIEPIRQRMGWNFCWVSSMSSGFNYDFHVSFHQDEARAGKTFYNSATRKLDPRRSLCPVSAFSTKIQWVKSSSPMEPLIEGTSSSWECMASSMCYPGVAKNTGRFMVCPTGLRYMTDTKMTVLTNMAAVRDSAQDSSRLVHPLTGSTTWVQLVGTVKTRSIWDGLGNIEELEAGNATTYFKGMTLFLYSPDSHQWSQTFASSSDGILSYSLFGSFKGGHGEFYDQEEFNGKMVLVRFVWSDITPDSHHVEQAFSDDGGKTWEPNFIATLERVK